MSVGVDYICVDLDGTLVRTDLFFEAAIRLVKENPFNLVRLVLWLLRGRSVAKEHVAQRVDIDAGSLPYETRLLEYLRRQKAEGKCLILATASHHIHAERVAVHLGIFDHVLATQAPTNMKSGNKLAAIRRLIGDIPFAYCGDSAADRPIWREASENILVNAPEQDVMRARSEGKAAFVIESPVSRSIAFAKEMRVHQYAKNALVLVPLLTSHTYIGPGFLLTALFAFLLFSVCASGVYFLNDLLDLEADRQHAQKRNRPLASGDLPIAIGVVGAVCLPFVAFLAAGFLLNAEFLGVLVLYYLLTNAYSFFLKRLSTADVMTLAVLYSLRVVAGAAALEIPLSSWLMAFSVFVFVSLAYLKRYIEVAALSDEGGVAHGRGYSAADRETMFSLGIANITASVLVLALYINSDEVSRQYQTPEILWLLCLLLLYWGNRIWVGARRGKIAGDPVVFALRDKVSGMVGVAFLVVAIAAKYLRI